MSGFEAMKADLVARGLIDREGRVTPAGDAYTDQLIADLKSAELPAPPVVPVQWKTGRRGG